MARVAVVGVGAIGAVFAAQLIQTRRHELTLLSRTPRTNLTVVTPDGVIREPAQVACDVDRYDPHDWVLLAAKTTHTAFAGRLLADVCGPQTRVAVLQNGVEARERVSLYAQGAVIVPTVVRCPAERLPGGAVISRGPATLVVAEDEDGRGLEELFHGSAARIVLSPDVTTELWRKLCTNVAAGSITALTGLPMSVLRQPSAAELARSLVRECASVAAAEGGHLGEQDQSWVLDQMLQQPPDATTSMMRARLVGEELEHDAITGAVLRAAARHDISAPATAVVHALLEAVSGPPA